GNEWFG
ncbi:GGDEF family domain protein, partial [Vibrio parahaemolyticus V-223/04]